MLLVDGAEYGQDDSSWSRTFRVCCALLCDLRTLLMKTRRAKNLELIQSLRPPSLVSATSVWTLVGATQLEPFVLLQERAGSQNHLMNSKVTRIVTAAEQAAGGGGDGRSQWARKVGGQGGMSGAAVEPKTNSSEGRFYHTHRSGSN